MITLQAESLVPTDFGNFRVMAFSVSEKDWMPHIALVAENTDFSKPINVRFHSECITGEVFHSKKCECGQQLDAAMKFIQENGGIIVYLRQEGRNIGIINKLKAQLGLPADDRDFNVAIEILKLLDVKEINLLTNNPDKIKFVENSEIHLNKRIPLQMEANENSKEYLKTKKEYFGHLLDDETEK